MMTYLGRRWTPLFASMGYKPRVETEARELGGR
jgi:hypothetical protein